MSETILNFILGFIVGAAVVGASVWRVQAVQAGSMTGAWQSGLLNSVAYYFSIHWIAHDNLGAYMGTAVGSSLIVIYMAYKKKQREKV